MRLAKHYLESIAGVEIFPIISFLIFFTFFILVGIYVFLMSKKHVSEMASMPLNNDESENEENDSIFR